MSDYHPPVKDMHFVLTKLLGFTHEEMDSDMIQATLDEAAKLASGVLAPLNKSGDESGAKLDDGQVTTAPGFKDAYGQYCEGGWNSVPFDPEFGGMGLPWAIAFPIQEMWQGANMSFGLCPLLNQGAIKAISAHGSDEQKAQYLEKLISGEWTGTMNLTEPQAGSDLGLIRAKAEKQDDGSYKISGQKIYITYGEHDLTENIIHLVLARTPDAPEDVKGISLFIVPKTLEDGTRNSLSCIGLEHKLGIHASPTCTMDFDGATGYLIGDENAGLKYMFTMMNNARLSVGLQGVAIAEAAYQAAFSYANDRVQSKDLESGERVVIAQHADVKRMLLSMKSQIEAARALTYEAAMALDGDNQDKVELLTPIVKSWATDMACSVASTGVQIHGGMGFIEETGAAQFLRDARILPIYEGTNGIQALDLVFRKLLRSEGALVTAYIDQMKESLPSDFKEKYSPAFDALEDVTKQILTWGAQKNMQEAASAAMPYLNGFGIIAGGVLLARAAAVAKEGMDTDFASEKAKLAAFYAANILPHALAEMASAKSGSAFVD